METITENHNEAISRVVKSSPTAHTHRTFPHLRLTEHWEENGWKTVRASGSGSLPWDCVSVITEATPRKSHQRDCPSMSWTRTAPTRKDHNASSLHKELGQLRTAESRRDALPQERAHQLVAQCQADSSEMCPWVTLCIAVHLYIHVFICTGL